MALPQYTPERRRELAARLGIDEQYIYQVCKGIKVASPALARRLHEIDANAKLQDLRPDDWQTIWPELVVAGSPSAAMLHGGRREEDHTSDFGVLDINGPELDAEIRAVSRLVGDTPKED